MGGALYCKYMHSPALQNKSLRICDSNEAGSGDPPPFQRLRDRIFGYMYFNAYLSSLVVHS